MSQGIQRNLAIFGRSDQIAVIAARTGYHDQAFIGGRCAFSVQPTDCAVNLGLFQKIMMDVEQACSFCAPTVKHSDRNQTAVKAGKFKGCLVFGKIGCRRFALFRQTLMPKGGNMALQNLLTQSARTAMHQQLQMVFIKICRKQIGAINGINGLQLGKMVAAANRTYGKAV